MKWRVNVLYFASQVVEVDADSKEEAQEKAIERGGVVLCHHCADELDIGDSYDAVAEPVDE